MPSDFRWHSFLVSAGYLPDTKSPANMALSLLFICLQVHTFCSHGTRKAPSQEGALSTV